MDILIVLNTKIGFTQILLSSPFLNGNLLPNFIVKIVFKTGTLEIELNSQTHTNVFIAYRFHRKCTIVIYIFSLTKLDRYFDLIVCWFRRGPPPNRDSYGRDRGDRDRESGFSRGTDFDSMRGSDHRNGPQSLEDRPPRGGPREDRGFGGKQCSHKQIWRVIRVFAFLVVYLHCNVPDQ